MAVPCSETWAKMQACREMKMDPFTHVLRHKKKDMDLTLPFRLANLSNNATVELVELDAAVGAQSHPLVPHEREEEAFTP